MDMTNIFEDDERTEITLELLEDIPEEIRDIIHKYAEGFSYLEAKKPDCFERVYKMKVRYRIYFNFVLYEIEGKLLTTALKITKKGHCFIKRKRYDNLITDFEDTVYLHRIDYGQGFELEYLLVEVSE